MNLPTSLPAIDFSYWLLQTLAMMVTAFLIPGLKITSPLGAILPVVALAFVNAHLWNAALFFQVPSSFSTHALTLLAANGLIFWILVKLLPGIESKGVLPVLAAPLVFTGCSLLISKYGTQIDWNAVGAWLVEKFNEARQYFQGAKKTVSMVPHPISLPPLSPA